MLKFLRRRHVDKLWDQAQALLAEGAYEEVLELATQMERHQYSGTFELAAQAYVGLGRRPEAIAVLERGLRLAPQAWLDWELLGNCYCDEARFNAAASAYEQALSCEDVRADSIRVNQAILAMRCGNAWEALRLVESIESQDLQVHKASVQAQALLDTGRARDALELCQAFRTPEELTLAQKQHLAGLCVTQADAMTALDVPIAAIDAHLREALCTIPSSELLLTYYRQFRARSSERARLFCVVADFELDPKLRWALRAVGFLRSGQAIADSPEEAVSFFRELEDDILLALAEAPDVSELEEHAGPLKGVTVRSPRIYYQRRD
jgi:tetratricopeptide (TPR) repeat protein